MKQADEVRKDTKGWKPTSLLRCADNVLSFRSRNHLLALESV